MLPPRFVIAAVMLVSGCSRDTLDPPRALGPNGAQLASAGSGLSGYVLIERSFSMAPLGTAYRGLVLCPGGKRAVGGGVQHDATGLVVAETRPRTPDGTGWVFGVSRKTGGTTVTFAGWAVCADAPPGYALISQSFSMTGLSLAGDVACPIGKKAVVGGVENTNLNFVVQDNHPRSDGTGWAFVVSRETGGSTVTFNGWAVCADAPPGYQLMSQSFTTAGLVFTGDVACLAGKRVLGGGVENANAGLMIRKTHPQSDGTGWSFAVSRETGSSTVAFTGWGVCADATPPPGTFSCLVQGGTVVPVSFVQTAAYSNTNLADSTKVDARYAQFLVSYATSKFAARHGGGTNLCWSGGEMLGQLPPATPWLQMKETRGLIASLNSGDADIEDVRVFNYGDGISHDKGGGNWIVRRTYVKHNPDDCVSNDFYHSATIEDSFFDGCYVGISAQEFTGTPPGTANVMVIRNSLIRAQAVDSPFVPTSEPNRPSPNFGTFWKWHVNAPQVKLHNTVFRADANPALTGGQRYMSPPAGRLTECSNNTFVWLGAATTPIPDSAAFAATGCFTLTRDKTVWDNAAAAWHAAHPPTLGDLAPPVVGMFQPGVVGSATLTGVVTLIATAIDERNVVGVRFQLNGGNIGAEQTTPTAYVHPQDLRARDLTTKYQITWDSRTVVNGVYSLQAVARDAVGRVTTSAPITVTVQN